MSLTSAEKMTLKGQGCILQKDGEFFTIRFPVIAGNLTSAQARAAADAAERYGRGYYGQTVRMGIEIPYICYEDLNAVRELMASVGLSSGGTGKRVRPVVSCKGTICSHGLYDTQGLCAELSNRFLGKDMPGKCKIGLTGCPNNCVKAQLNDIGIIGYMRPAFEMANCVSCGNCAKACPAKALKMADGKIQFNANTCVDCGTCVRTCKQDAIAPLYHGVGIYIGGRFGRAWRMGTMLKMRFQPEEVPEVVEKILGWYQENAQAGERISAVVDRLGMEALEAVLKK